MSNRQNHFDILQAVARTGEILAEEGCANTVRLVIAGGVAGLLSGLTRATLDCDVLSCSDDDQWESIERAARQAATELDLPDTWLNRECANYADCFPLGWEHRAKYVDQFGPLEVYCVSRVDLISSKLVSSPSRPQDVIDIKELKPTNDEFVFAEEHLDRLSAEHLDGYDYASQRAILQAIRSEQ